MYIRGHVEYHDSLNANVLKEYNLEVPGLRGGGGGGGGVQGKFFWRIRFELWAPQVLKFDAFLGVAPN